MKRALLFAFSTLTLVIVLTAGSMNENGRAGYTGSPGEVTCNTTNCHNSFVLNSGDGTIGTTSTMINWIYEPSTNYTISIKVAKPGVSLFGFGVEILTSSNDNAGTIVVTDTVHTQLKSRFVNGIIRKNIVHKLNGGASQDSVTFSFNWTAPNTGSGTLTMYFIGNATNANGNVNGDYIYNSSQIIMPSGENNIENIISAYPFTVYPNPAGTNISLHYYLQKNEVVSIKLYDMRGSLVYLLTKSNHFAGENNELIFLPSECHSGLYLLSIESPSGRESRKLIIN